MKPDLEKIRAVKDFPTPETKKQVRSFLGLTSYYRKYIKNYVIIAACTVTDLIKKRLPEKVQWTKEWSKLFKTLKHILQTDASNRGVGVLSQKDAEVRDKPIHIFSRKLLPREQRYSIV